MTTYDENYQTASTVGAALAMRARAYEGGNAALAALRARVRATVVIVPDSDTESDVIDMDRSDTESDVIAKVVKMKTYLDMAGSGKTAPAPAVEWAAKGHTTAVCGGEVGADGSWHAAHGAKAISVVLDDEIQAGAPCLEGAITAAAFRDRLDTILGI